eukprot:g22204.t1
MKARPKSLALAKFQQAGQATIEKNRQQKAESKKDKGIDVIQVGSIGFASFLVLWIIASTVVSAVFTVRYMGIVEDGMDRGKTALSIRANGRPQRVPLETIMQISVGAEHAVESRRMWLSQGRLLLCHLPRTRRLAAAPKPLLQLPWAILKALRGECPLAWRLTRTLESPLRGVPHQRRTLIS